jgi:hypothetical protein
VPEKVDEEVMSNSRCPKPRALTFGGVTAAGFILLVAAWAGPKGGQGQNAPAILKLSVVDEGSKQTIPARVEVLDKDGKAYVAEDALLIGGD